MRFVIDESSFNLGSLADAEVETVLADLVTAIDHCQASGQTVAKCTELYIAQLRPDLSMIDLLYTENPPVPVPRDLREALRIKVDQCVAWDQPGEPIATRAVRVGGVSLEAPSIAHAHAAVVTRAGRACIVLRSCGRRGVLPVDVGGVIRDLHFVAEEPDTPVFYRSLYELEDVGEDDYFDVAKLAFPCLTFADGLARQFRRFSRPYRAIRSDVTRHLAALNDDWAAACTGHPAPAEIQRRMRASTGVDMSPESPNTKANRRAWAQRRVVLDGREYYCDWHTKLSPTADRIHFHPGDPNLHTGPVVGIFTDHLGT